MTPGLTQQARDELKAIRSRDAKAYLSLRKFIEQRLASHPLCGYPLRGGLEGLRAEHVHYDRFRVIWRPPTDDGGTLVVRVGPRFNSRGHPIYAEPIVLPDDEAP